MKFTQPQRRPEALHIAPTTPPPTPVVAPVHSMTWTTERRQGERGPEWRSLLVTRGMDGTATHQETQWRSRRHWLMDYAIQHISWKRWHVGDVSKQVFHR